MILSKELYQVLPITYNSWNSYPIYDLFSNLADRADKICHVEDGNWRYITVYYSNSLTLPSVEEIDKRTVTKILGCAPKTLMETDFTCLMPRHVWFTLSSALNAATIGRRRSIARVFIYLYYYSMRFLGSFSHSREQMLQDLHINNHTLSDSLKWLEQHEFIVRSSYSMRPHERYARRYYIPEDFWSSACKKEWANLQKVAVKS